MNKETDAFTKVTSWWVDIHFNSERCNGAAAVRFIVSGDGREVAVVSYDGQDWLFVPDSGGLRLRAGQLVIDPTDANHVVHRTNSGSDYAYPITEIQAHELPRGTLSRLSDSSVTQIRIQGTEGICDATLDRGDHQWIKGLLNASRQH